jgi:hypothetical protein
VTSTEQPIPAAIEKFKAMAETAALEAQRVPGTEQAIRATSRAEAYEFCARHLKATARLAIGGNQ